MTRCSANEDFHMENLEILGDCFLKLTVSMYLYYHYPTYNVGQLNAEKTKEISNENLYRLAVINRLKNYLYTDEIVVLGSNSNWLPPGFISKLNHYTHSKAKRKAFADMIEALIGAFLISTNYLITIKFMHCLGLNVIPTEEIDLRINEDMKKIFYDEGFEEIEKQLNYKFQNKEYLITAFTHSSKSLINSYERLEFLGDALLDFLIIHHTFLNYDMNLTPGRVTDIRQDLSNNNHLAYILVSSNLHTKIRYNSNELSNQINSYVNNRDIFPKNQSIIRQEIHQWSTSTAPKILADVFEALIAGIFFDCQNSLDIVWKIIEPFLGRYFDRSIIDPKLNPLRLFSDQGGRILSEFIDETGCVCLVQMPDGTLREGHGKNKKLAKYNACQGVLNNKN